MVPHVQYAAILVTLRIPVTFRKFNNSRVQKSQSSTIKGTLQIQGGMIADANLTFDRTKWKEKYDRQ